MCGRGAECLVPQLWGEVPPPDDVFRQLGFSIRIFVTTFSLENILFHIGAVRI
jgi:hypothetical protein